jgi:hypothetical protein
MAGSLVESAGGIGAIVLAIVALTGVLPMYLTAIAAIALGVALVFEGLANVARYSQLFTEEGAMATARTTRVETGSGVTLELFCGAGGIVLGILALLHIAAMILLPVAAIVFGVGLIFSSGTRATLARHLVEGFHGHEFSTLVAREAMQAVMVTEVCIGIGGAVLGILALIGNAPLILTEVAMLAFGCAVVLGGLALSGRMFTVLHH